MIELILVLPMLGAPKIEQSPLIQKKNEPVVTETKPKELTVEEKIAQNYYKCDESTQYIRADNAECLNRPQYRAPESASVTERRDTQISRENTNTAPQISSGANSYEPGQCVWYIKNLRPDLPNNLGNATDWLYNAQAQGLATGSIPQVNAVGWVYGHVVLITGVNSDGTVSYTDMNGRYIPYEIGTGTKPANFYTYIY